MEYLATKEIISQDGLPPKSLHVTAQMSAFAADMQFPEGKQRAVFEAIDKITSDPSPSRKTIEGLQKLVEVAPEVPATVGIAVGFWHLGMEKEAKDAAEQALDRWVVSTGENVSLLRPILDNGFGLSSNLVDTVVQADRWKGEPNKAHRGHLHDRSIRSANVGTIETIRVLDEFSELGDIQFEAQRLYHTEPSETLKRIAYPEDQ